MNKYQLRFIIGAFVALFATNCGLNPNKSDGSGVEIAADSLSANQIKALTEEVNLDELDEDIQVFTLKIGNDPDKNHLTVSFPITKYAFINEAERTKAETLIAEFKKEVAEQSPQASSALDFNQHFEVTCHSSELISFLHTRSTSLGNNYDDTFYASLYDLQAERRLSASDLFDSVEQFAAFAESISELAQREVRKHIDKTSGLDTPEERNALWEEVRTNVIEGTRPTDDNYDALFVNEAKEWYIIFDKYQIASGAMGTFRFAIPTDLIARHISPKWAKLVEQPTIAPEPPISTPSQTQPRELNPNAPRVALTFDDGPSVYTPRLLDILRDEGVRATFFVIGKSASVQKKTMMRMAQEGHNIGNHSYDHKNFAKISLDEARRQILLTNEAVAASAGIKPTYFRFPYGAYTNDKLPLVGLPIISWSVDPLDWKHRDATRIASEMSKASSGAIILAHDIHKSTVDAMPQTIRNLKAKGYQIVTLDELFAHKTIKANQIYTNGK